MRSGLCRILLHPLYWYAFSWTKPIVSFCARIWKQTTKATKKLIISVDFRTSASRKYNRVNTLGWDIFFGFWIYIVLFSNVHRIHKLCKTWLLIICGWFDQSNRGGGCCMYIVQCFSSWIIIIMLLCIICHAPVVLLHLHIGTVFLVSPPPG